MKNTIENKIIKSIIFSITFPIFIINANMICAQDTEPLRIYLNIECYQKDTEKDLKASVRARIGENRKMMPVSDIPIHFYNLTDSSEVFLGTASSNEKGEAIYTISGGTILNWNNEKGYRFMASFDGNENFKKATKKVSVREANIEISFTEIDSTKVILANAYEIDPSTAKKIPLDGIDLSFYVPGSFSLYKIGEDVLKDGICSINFPITLPGDSIGNLIIIAKIEEHDEFGNVEASAKKSWGKIRESEIIEERRGLGDTDAPLWMVYTLIFLMSAVWIHYIYVFVVIYLIKKDV